MSPPQIYEPKVGRTYRVHLDDAVFLARVVSRDVETVTVIADPNINPGVELPIDEFVLQRGTARFEEWI